MPQTTPASRCAGRWVAGISCVPASSDRTIYCFSMHADSIRTIPALQHDPARPEDVNTRSEDHTADEWRYACMSRPFVRVPVARTSVPDVGYAAYRSAAAGDWKLY